MNPVALANTLDSPIAVPLSERVHWIGALDPNLRSFDIILKTANGTSDTVKQGFEDDFFARLESVAAYDDIKAIVLNHLEPNHTGAFRLYLQPLRSKPNGKSHHYI